MGCALYRPPQTRLRGFKDDAYRSELEDMRAYALNRPKEASVLPLMNVYRVESWILLGFLPPAFVMLGGW